ncbi:hypothetical protein [Thermogutta sp.]|uniref:hypothetical protein n=1 Tax=Thermogutta sp. TaxID=1962930 RepID=UPI00321FF7A6
MGHVFTPECQASNDVIPSEGDLTVDPTIPPELASEAFSLLVLWLTLLAAVLQYLLTVRM